MAEKLEKAEVLDMLAESFGMAKKVTHITKFSESTKTLYADEEVAKMRIKQIDTISSKKEKPKPSTLNDALTEFVERQMINADYEKGKKKLSSMYVNNDKAKWNSSNKTI